jgi:hypothetical protein
MAKRIGYARVGKKYQWAALRELLARMADNLAYVGDTWERDGGMPMYRGARQIGLLALPIYRHPLVRPGP